MRKSTVLVAIGFASCTLATALVFAAPPATTEAPQWPKATVSLSGEDALARLQVSNPRHFAIVRKILAAADEICDATKSGPIPTKFAAQNIFCAQALWLTSNPPKRQLQFRIDDTQYFAQVVMRDRGAKLQPAH